MSPKPNYVQKYRLEWEKHNELKNWIQPVSNNPTLAHCKYCKCNIAARLADLKKHANRDKHVSRAAPFTSTSQSKITESFSKVNEITPVQRAEGKIALYAAVHTSLLAVDHLSDLINEVFSDSNGTPTHVHRTKCTNIINNILGPHFRAKLIADIRCSYSLIVDESTDISVYKMLGVCIRYFSITYKKIMTSFLGLIKIEDGTVESIYQAITQLLTVNQLDRTKLCGLGTDNASVMIGTNQGLYKKIQSEYNLPNLVLVRCICHSLQLALSKATEETIPRNIEFILKETYNWFAFSTKRQTAYIKLYSLINDDKIPLKILKTSATRWISIEPVARRILDQWLELKSHFEVARRTENCYTAELLYSMYNDPINKVYLRVLYPILEEVQKVNKAFQSSSADSTKLQNDLFNLVKGISKKILKPNAQIDILHLDEYEAYLDPDPYMGYVFENSCRENNISDRDKKDLKIRILSFFKKLLDQLKQRLPSNIKIFETMNYFSIQTCLNPKKRSITEIAKTFYGNKEIMIIKIETQWNNLSNIQWSNINSTNEFWSEVSSYRDAAGLNPFEELVNFALKLLCLPHSNADVERLFSHMNLIKNKLRNRIGIETVNNILKIRFGLLNANVCCKTYILPDDVLKHIGHMKTYTPCEDVPVEVLHLLEKI